MRGGAVDVSLNEVVFSARNFYWISWISWKHLIDHWALIKFAIVSAAK